MIREIKGDMFNYIDPNKDFIAHCISADFALGAGIAKTIEEKYHIRDILKAGPFANKKYVKDDGFVIVTGTVFNLVTKGKYYEKPSYTSIHNAIFALAEHCHVRGINDIHMPEIGCGLDGLKWKIVFGYICSAFIPYGINVYIYHL